MSNAVLDPVPSPYVDREQRSAANRLGLWTFLATEILFFGGLFACYTVYRWSYPAAFAVGSRHLEYGIGTANTAVLLTSSLSMALADLAVKRDDHRAVRGWLGLTWMLGATFLGLKCYEYFQKYAEHMIPGGQFDYHGGPVQLQLFVFLYFAMTGLHAVHMLFGLAAIAWLVWRNHRRSISRAQPEPVAMVGLYWHFVDCVWIFLYPLLYLIGR